VNSCPDAGLEYLVGQIREAMEHTLLAREPPAPIPRCKPPLSACSGGATAVGAVPH
jgi:hypothetical protein